jgi:hypothetical protein
VQAICGSLKVTLLRSPTHNLISRESEDEAAFRVRLQQVAREERDAAVTKLRTKYAPKITALNERMRRAEQAVQRESAQATQARLSSVISIGSTLLGAFLGRKPISTSNLGRAGTALRNLGRASEQAADVSRAGETVEAVQAHLKQLDEQFQSEVATIESRFNPVDEVFEPVELRPTKSNVTVQLVGLAWTPVSCIASKEPRLPPR